MYDIDQFLCSGFVIWDVLYFGNVKWSKTIQETGNLLIRAAEGVVYTQWKMFWLRTKAFLIHFLRFAFSNDTLGWAFELLFHISVRWEKNTPKLIKQKKKNAQIAFEMNISHDFDLFTHKHKVTTAYDLWLIKNDIFFQTFFLFHFKQLFYNTFFGK